MNLSNKMTVWAKIMLFSSTAMWGSSYFILKRLLDVMPVYLLLALRFFGAAVIMPLICFRKWKLFNLRYLWTGAVTGVMLGFAYIFQTIGLDNTTPGTNAFLTAVYCVLVPFMCWVVMKKKPDMFNIIAAVISLVGIGLVCLDGGGMKFSFLGEGFTLICGLFFGAHIVAVAKWGEKLDLLLYTALQFIAAFIVCGVFSVFAGVFRRKFKSIQYRLCFI